MANRFEQFPNQNDPEKNGEGASLQEGAPSVPKLEQLEGVTNESPGEVKLGKNLEPKSAGERDRQELEKFLTETQLEILLNVSGGGQKKLGIDDIERHDTEFAPRKMVEIETDAEKWAVDMPANLENLMKDPEGYESYVKLLKSSGRENEVMGKKECFAMLQNIKAACERKDPEVERLLREQYVRERLKNMLGARTESEKREPVEDPYKEIETRLTSAKEKLEQRGLKVDAENLDKTIGRLKRQLETDIAQGRTPHKMLIWSSQMDSSPWEEPEGIQKLFAVVDKWMSKVPFIGQNVDIGWRKPVRDVGGTIIRKDGSEQEFFTYTHFKKEGEEPRDEGFGEFPARTGYHYVEELQEGDEIITWQPSKQAKSIILENLSNFGKPNPKDFSGSILGSSGIEYWMTSVLTNNVKFRCSNRREPETGQTYSYLSLEVPMKPHKYKPEEQF